MSNSKPNILIDLCGVIYNMQDYLETYLHVKAFNMGIPIVCNNNHYNLNEYLGKELKELFFKELYEEYLKNANIYLFADKYTKLIGNYYNIHLVTARGCIHTDSEDIKSKEIRDRYIKYTIESLKKNNIFYNHLEFSNDKIDYIKENNIQIAVEDRLETLQNIKENTKAIPICYNQTYNYDAKSYGIKTVYSWPHLAQELLKMIKDN